MSRRSASGSSVLTRDIAAGVAAHYGIRPQAILSPCRMAPVVRARHIVAFLASECGRTTGQIGRVLMRDPTTIRDGIRRIAGLAATDQRIAADIAAIRASLEVGR